MADPVDWAYVTETTAITSVLESWRRAAVELAAADAGRAGYDPVTGDDGYDVPGVGTVPARIDVSPLDVMEVEAKADPRGEPEWDAADPAALDRERERRRERLRRVRRVRVEMKVRPRPEAGPALVELTPDAARVLAGEALGLLEPDASKVVCGSPRLRHEFLGDAERLRDGVIAEARCRRRICGRTVTRAELLRQAHLEAEGIRWWETTA